MASPITASGLGSNLDVEGLVTKLMDVERQPLTKLDAKEAAVQVKISAYGTLRGALSQFHSAVSSLADGTRFTALRATVADGASASATAATGAAAGSYSLEVTHLATSQKLNSGLFQNVTDDVGTGTLTIEYGTSANGAFTVNGQKAAQTVTIDSAHSSLVGVRDAINAAKIGVSATIVNDGTGNRLVLTGKDTGAASSIRISAADDDGNNTDAAGLSRLAYDPAAPVSGQMSQLIAASDATFLLDGLPISKSGNTVTDAIQGVTLQLQKTNVNAATTLDVDQDTGAVQAAVNSLVNAYNDLSKTLNDLGKYDAASKTAGPLQGDVTLRTIADQLQTDMTSPIAGIGGKYKALPQIGLTFDRNGQLTLDSQKLQDALAADPNAVAQLFAAGGNATDSLVSYAGSSAATKPGTYDLTVSQLGSQGTLVGGAAAGLTIDGTNDGLSFKINGVTGSVTLSHKTYASASALAAEVQSKINGASAFAGSGITVSVSEASGVLTLTSDRYGSVSEVASLGGTGASNLLGASPTATAGRDVAGTIGGAAAVGSGQTLTALGASNANGLKLKIAGGGLGARGEVRFSFGVAAQLDALLTRLDSGKSTISAATDSLNSQVKDIDKQRDAINARLVDVEARYRQQFGALDILITQMQTTSSSLAQQLASLPAITK